MFDYYNHVYSLSEEKLSDEIEGLNKKLMRISASSPMFNQLMDMLETAQMAYGEIQMKRRVKVEDTVLDIGTIESTEHTPDYSTDDILTVLVQGYTKKDNK